MSNNKIKLPPPNQLTAEDIHWAETVRRAVDGLAAIADANADGCATEWLAMVYGLESVRHILDDTLKDYEERIEGGAK